MADPVSIGMIALTVGSQLFSGASQASTDRANAALDDQNAQNALIDGARQSESILRQARATTAEGRAAMGANGVAVDTGSALDYVTQNAIEREFDMMNARYAAGQQASAYATRASQERKAASSALIGGFLKAGASAISGFGNLNANTLKMPGTTMPVPGK